VAYLEGERGEEKGREEEWVHGDERGLEGG
jgi:hypothetical protein